MKRVKFLYTHLKNPPGRFEVFVYKYFGERLIGAVLAFSSGFVGAISAISLNQLENPLMGRISLVLMISWLSVLITVPAYIIHKLRIRKIRNELNLTEEQYDHYVYLYIKKIK